MNVNAAIIDQRLHSLVEDIRLRAKDELKITDEGRLKSLAFVYLSVKTILDLSDEEAFDCLTEGGGDFGIDAIHVSETLDNEFTVSLIQGKYYKDLVGINHFPENGIKNLIYAIRCLFDPSSEIQNINNRLKVKVEEVRSLIRDGYIPQVRAIGCSNGIQWNDAAEEEIRRFDAGDQVTFEYFNHDNFLSIMQSLKPVSDTLQFSGKALIEDFNFSRVFVGRIAAADIAALIKRHGDRLLERNVRRYLGLQGNRVNAAIKETLQGTDKANFYFYNNGITMICEKFTHNALQSSDFQVKIDNLQIINGGQTCMTIFRTLENEPQPNESFVLVRLYQLQSGKDDLIRQITYATNSQNPVDLKDLRANDNVQRRLETDIKQLGFEYRRKRTEGSLKSFDITTGTVAEAVLSVWRQKPHQAKFFTREHFGKLYSDIFSADLNGAQAVIAVLIYRIAENKRKRPPEGSENFVPYASCFVAMQMGKYLLCDLRCNLEGLNHTNFSMAQALLEEKSEEYFGEACKDIKKALLELYGNENVSVQQLSATFRRGDLIDKLSK